MCREVRPLFCAGLFLKSVLVLCQLSGVSMMIQSLAQSVRERFTLVVCRSFSSESVLMPVDSRRFVAHSTDLKPKSYELHFANPRSPDF